jgi:hypothetical protein
MKRLRMMDNLKDGVRSVTNRMNRLRMMYNLILVGVAFAAFFWILESAIHAFLLNDGNLIDQVLRPDANEIWMRSLVCFMFIFFSLYAQNIVKKLRQAKKSLQQSRDELELRVRERTAELDKANKELTGEIEEADSHRRYSGRGHGCQP